MQGGKASANRQHCAENANTRHRRWGLPRVRGAGRVNGSRMKEIVPPERTRSFSTDRNYRSRRSTILSLESSRAPDTGHRNKFFSCVASDGATRRVGTARPSHKHEHLRRLNLSRAPRSFAASLASLGDLAEQKLGAAFKIGSAINSLINGLFCRQYHNAPETRAPHQRSRNV
jgi:hypothetical protein